MGRNVAGGLVIALGLMVSAARADDWPQWLGPQRDGIWRETDILQKFPKSGPNVVWRTPINGGYTGPAVAGGRVYVMDFQRAPMKEGEKPQRGRPTNGVERVLCLDAGTGKVLWTHAYDCAYRIAYQSGPRTTPVVTQGRVYTLGAMGDLLCLDADTGKVQWSRSFEREYKVKFGTPPDHTAFWGWSAHPLLDGDKLISLVGGDGSAVVAFHKDTGKELWRALTVKEIGYAPPMIFEAGGKRQLIAWHTEAVNSLDPETGKVYWTVKFPASEPVRPAITVATPRKEGDLLFFTSPHHGSLMLKLASDKPAATVVWKGSSDDVEKPDGIHSLISSPVFKDGHVYGVGSYGDLRCVKADDGKQLWESYAATEGKKTEFASAFLVGQDQRYFIFNDKGGLVIARLTPKGYEEIDRTHLIDPTLAARGRVVVWSHPAFANRCVFVRNDKEIICVSLAAG